MLSALHESTLDQTAADLGVIPLKIIEPISKIPLGQIQTLALAGGGNRCWWQGGALSFLLNQGWELPEQLVGTSAGAAVAASLITDGPRAALDSCIRLYSANPRVFDWNGLSQLKLTFAHQHVYPAWIDSFINADNFASVLASKTRLRVGLTRPAKMLGLAGSVAVGTIAYLIDKHFGGKIHPRLPKFLGLRQDFVDLHSCQTISDAQALLNASAAAPPLMPAQWIGGSLAIDGGYTDNAPIHDQSAEERSKTLVLLTRYYSKLPPLFCHAGRIYWQPSQRIPVSTWDCTARTTVREAFSLGEKNAAQAIGSGLLSFV